MTTVVKDRIYTGGKAVGAVIVVIWVAIMLLDWLNIIDRHAMNWEAFATLTGSLSTILTGLAAVAGAVWIGSRQTAIQNRQTDILDRQVKLQELALNSELYDKRIEIYKAVSEYVAGALRSSRYPTKEVQNKFQECLAASRFIFRGHVHQSMRDIVIITSEMVRFQRKLDKLIHADENDETLKAAYKDYGMAFGRLEDIEVELPIIFREIKIISDDWK